MRYLRAILKFFVFASLTAAVAVGAMAIYMNFYGAKHIKSALSEALGSRVGFKSVAINMGKAAASFKGFTVAGNMGFEENVFSADTFTVSLNKEKFEKERKAVFDSVYIKGAKLYIIRNKAGVLNISLPSIKTSALDERLIGPGSVAYAAETASRNPFHDVLKVLKNIKIEDSTIAFEDHFGMASPYRIWCDKFYADIVSTEAQGYVATSLNMGCRVPQSRGGDGWARLGGGIALYPDYTNMEVKAETGNVELSIFAPYFQRNTPFYLRSGRFNSRTDFRMHGGNIDSLTTMYITNMSLRINPHDPNAQFLQVSINRLGPYLMSGNNIVFDFTMKGSPANPQFGVGPKVKYAIGMVAMEEVAKAIQTIQRMR